MSEEALGTWDVRDFADCTIKGDYLSLIDCLIRRRFQKKHCFAQSIDHVRGGCVRFCLCQT